MKKSLRFLSVLLALALCFTGMAVSAFAEDPGQTTAATPAGEGGPTTTDPPTPQGECICVYHCSDMFDIEGANRFCPYCYDYCMKYMQYRWANPDAPLTADAATSLICKGHGTLPCICSPGNECYKYGWYVHSEAIPAGIINGTIPPERAAKCAACMRSVGAGNGFLCGDPNASASEERDYVPDVSGKYRTTPERIKDKLKPADIAQQTLYIDETTYAILNLYDADGNLITATLSSDGHFYIVPDSSGNYVYIPTGK